MCLSGKKVPHSLYPGNSPWLAGALRLPPLTAHSAWRVVLSNQVNLNLYSLLPHSSTLILAMYPSAARRSLASLIPPKIATPGAVVSSLSPVP